MEQAQSEEQAEARPHPALPQRDLNLLTARKEHLENERGDGGRRQHRDWSNSFDFTKGQQKRISLLHSLDCPSYCPSPVNCAFEIERFITFGFAIEVHLHLISFKTCVSNNIQMHCYNVQQSKRGLNVKYLKDAVITTCMTQIIRNVTSAYS